MQDRLEQFGTRDEVEHRARVVAVEVAAQAHLAQARALTEPRIAKIKAQVHERLTQEVRYWDHRASYLQLQASAGKQPPMQPEYARRRSDEMAERRRRRLSELDDQARLSSQLPVIVGSALVIPAGLIAEATGEAPSDVAARARRQPRSSDSAVDAVLGIENTGWSHGDGDATQQPGLRHFVNNDNRPPSAYRGEGPTGCLETFAVTCNEILTGLNTGENYVLAMVEVSPEDNSWDRVRIRAARILARSAFFGDGLSHFHWKEIWERASEPCRRVAHASVPGSTLGLEGITWSKS